MAVYSSNVLLVMGLISTLALGAFGEKPSDEMLGTRSGIVLTLQLTTIAFKFVIADSLPKVSYDTTLDMYMNMCSIFLGIVFIENAIVARFGEMGISEDLRDILDGYFALTIASLWFAANAIFVYVIRKYIRKVRSFLGGDPEWEMHQERQPLEVQTIQMEWPSWLRRPRFQPFALDEGRPPSTPRRASESVEEDTTAGSEVSRPKEKDITPPLPAAMAPGERYLREVSAARGIVSRRHRVAPMIAPAIKGPSMLIAPAIKGSMPTVAVDNGSMLIAPAIKGSMPTVAVDNGPSTTELWDQLHEQRQQIYELQQQIQSAAMVNIHQLQHSTAAPQMPPQQPMAYSPYVRTGSASP